MKNAKKNKLKFRFRILAFILLLCIGQSAFAQAEFEETINFEADIDAQGIVDFTNRSFDVEIRTWDKNSVELQMQVKLRAKKQEDIDYTLEAIRNIEFNSFGNKLIVNTRFWESMTSNTNHKIKLKTGKKVVLKEYDVQIALYVPKSISIKIDNKYANIKMEGIAGEADIKMHSGKLYGASFGGSVELDLRYSKAFLETMPDATMELYDSDIELTTCGNLSLTSKYSKVEIDQSGDFVFDSYDDNITIGNLGNIDGSAKYSDFIFGPSTELLYNFYDCNLKGDETGNVKGQSKYSEISLSSTANVILTSSFDDSFEFDKVVSLACAESKYSDFDIEYLAERFQLQSYDDNVSIDNISPDFTQINIDGKYGDYRLTIPESAEYRLLIDMKYGKVDYPEESFVRKTYIKENSTVFLDATTKNSVEKAAKVVEIKGHDNKIYIQD